MFRIFLAGVLSVLLFGCSTPNSCVLDSACKQAHLEVKQAGLKNALLFVHWQDASGSYRHCFLVFQTSNKAWYIYDPEIGSIRMTLSGITWEAGLPEALFAAKQVVREEFISLAYYEQDS